MFESEKDMTPVLLEDLGMRFATEKSKQKSRYGLYQCQYCGKEFVATLSAVKREMTKSCGCLQLMKAKENKVHGQWNTRMYRIWSHIKQRCLNPKSDAYLYYGAIGITICEDWCNSFQTFYEWAMKNGYTETLTIDRISTSGNYEPDNCRWTTREVQARNTKSLYSHNTSGFRGVCFNKNSGKWICSIKVKGKSISLGTFYDKLDAAKAYERYVRLNNLEHNFTPVLSEEEIEELYKS